MLEKFKLKHPQLHNHLFTVTTFSKILALSLFTILPFVGFYLGMNYQKKIDSIKMIYESSKIIYNGNPIISPSLSHTISSTPKENLKSEDLYSIKLPEGWIKTKETNESPYGEKPKNYLSVRYENLNGDFLNLEANKPGSGYGADELWNYTFDNNSRSLKVSKDSTYQGCNMYKDMGMCTGGDNIFSLVIIGENQKIGSNEYFFYAGNIKKEQNINTDIYKQIIESIVFK